MPSYRSSQISPRQAANAPSPVNVTVDNKYGDSKTGQPPLYLPQGAWANGEECGTCALNSTYIDPGKTMDATWNDSTYHPGQITREIAIDFVGTAVYVYNIIVNHPPSPGVTVFTNLTFFVDNIMLGNYIHDPDPAGPSVLYDVPVFVNEKLANEKHTLRIESGGPTATLILFDYIQYTFDGSTPPASISPFSTSSLPSSSTTTPSSPPSTSPDPTPSGQPLRPDTIAAIVVSVALAAVFLFVLVAWAVRICASTPSPKTAEDKRKLVISDPQGYHDLLASDGMATTFEVPPVSPITAWSRPPPSSPPYPPPLTTPSHSPHRPPPRHRVDVPAPALSVAGTEHSLRHADLVRELAALDAVVSGIEKEAKPTLGLQEEVEVSMAGETSLRLNGEYTEKQTVRLASIRRHMKRVRRLIEDERRLMEEALPRVRPHKQ